MERKGSMEQVPKRKVEIARYPFHRQPPWILSTLFAMQHVLVQVALIHIVHCLLIDALPSDQRTRQHGYQLIATSLFASGVSTLLQTTLGCRLPLIQAPSFEYLIPAVILASSPMDTNSSHQNGNTSLQLSSCFNPFRPLLGRQVAFDFPTHSNTVAAENRDLLERGRKPHHFNPFLHG
ncbi:solute carrier family 23 member 3-like [Mustelus asterias]